MDEVSLLAALDDEIARLHQARALLSGAGISPTSEKSLPAPGKAIRQKRRLSQKARNRIAEAQRKRWAAVKAAQNANRPAASKALAKKASSKKAAGVKMAAPKAAKNAASKSFETSKRKGGFGKDAATAAAEATRL